MLNDQTPTVEQIKVFITIVERLSAFEADHRVRCGWGCFQEGIDQLPVREVVLVMDWLKNIENTKQHLQKMMEDMHPCPPEYLSVLNKDIEDLLA